MNPKEDLAEVGRPNSDLRGQTALIVEDDAVIGQLVLHALSSCGAEACLADGAISAMRMIEGGLPVNILICDIGLPDTSGLWVAEATRNRFPRAAVIMLTGDNSFEKAVEAIRAGADEYLTKPVARDLLIGAVGRALQGRAR